MKLNLGCGRIAFPLVRGAEGYPDHLQEMPDSVYEPGWVNVDKFAMPGVQEAVDLFRFPWVRSSNGNPFADSSVDEIWCSHLVEHVPHQVRLAAGLPAALAREYTPLVENLDGFFVFFYECWRLLKPDGVLHLRCPYGHSIAGMTDPSHTRYLTPGTFTYLLNDERDSAPFDYHLPMAFTMDPYALRFTPEWSKQLDQYTTTGIEGLLRKYFNVVDELRITLRAVKPD